MEFLKLVGGFLKLLVGAKAWEFVVALVGGYLAAKNLENLGRRQFMLYICIAVILGFTACDFAIPYAVEVGKLTEDSAKNIRPLAIILTSALSLRAMDVLYSLMLQLKAIQIKDIPAGFVAQLKDFFRGKK